MNKEIHREITPLKEKDCFLVLDKKRRKDFSFPLHFHPEFEITVGKITEMIQIKQYMKSRYSFLVIYLKRNF